MYFEDDYYYSYYGSYLSATSKVEDWRNLANAFYKYSSPELSGRYKTSGNGNHVSTTHEKGRLEEFRSIAQEIVDCAIDNDYGHYFEDRKFGKKDINEIERLATEFEGICFKIHKEVMQNVDNQVLESLQTIYESTSNVNDGDNVYTYGTRTVTNTYYDEMGVGYDVNSEVGNTLDYYLNEDVDSGLREMYNVYEEDYIWKVGLYSPDSYDDVIKSLRTDNEDNRALLYIGEIGSYNRTIDENSFANYIDEILIGLAVVAAIAITIVTVGAAAPAIVGAIGLGSLVTASGAAVGLGEEIALGAAGVAYGAVIGAGVGIIVANAGYFVNTTFGSDGYALDGTYLTENSKSEMYNRYMINTVKAGAMAGAAAGSSVAWLAETTIDGGEFIIAAFAGDKAGMAMSFASLLFSGDDIIKGVRNIGKGTDASKIVVNNFDNITKSGGIDTDIITDGSHLIKNNKGKVVGLEPNVTFKAGENGYIYKTDANGFLVEGYASDLKLSELDRIPHNPNTPGKLSGDHAGHIFGDRFGGSGELDNLMSQLGKTNQSGYRVMENGWAKVINNGGSITDVKWSAVVDSTGRPIKYTVEWFENGIPRREVFPN